MTESTELSGGAVLLMVFFALYTFGPSLGLIWRPGGGPWSTFCTCCGLAAGATLLFVPILSLILWVFAWVFMGLANSAIRKARKQDAILAAIQDQTRLLRRGGAR